MPTTSHTIYDILRDFQPTFAASIALIAAFTAYWGATSKLRYERQASERDLLRQKLSLFLRLRYRAEIIADAATILLNNKPASENVLFHAAKGSQQEFVLDMVWKHFKDLDDIEEAWRSLHLFPPAMAEVLDMLRRDLDLIVLWREPHFQLGAVPSEPGGVSALAESINVKARGIQNALNALVQRVQEQLKS